MKVMAWEEFRQLPNGAIFQEFSEDGCSLGELSIFGGANGDNDFVYAGLMPEVRDLCTFCTESLDVMGLSEGAHCMAIVTPQGFGRDGLYDMRGRRWLVWEDVDRARLAMWLVDPVEATGQMNNPPMGHVLVTGGGISEKGPDPVQQVSLEQLTKDRA